MNTINDFSKLKYFFIAILTILFVISQYGIFLTRKFSIVNETIIFDNITTVTAQTTTVPTNNTIITLNEPTEPTANPNKVHLVLMWTPYFGSHSDWPKISNLNCKYRNCELTTNRTLFNASDAVIFHWRDINTSDLPNHHTSANQTWILFNQESPTNSPAHAIVPLDSLINWTMTYRPDSDIYAPYGQFVSCDNSGWKPMFDFGEKMKSVAWIVSHCQTHSRREDYVRKLQQYIDVDIYGGCGKFKCGRNPSCLETIARKYKFYLSFENSLCKDYVTEKLFSVAKYEIIPIVLGGANYSALMPPNSYIDTFNFSSPKELAKYLRIVGSDRDKYNSYFRWKQNQCVVNTGWNFFCNMCEKLNKLNDRNTRNASLYDWWFTGANCNNNRVQY